MRRLRHVPACRRNAAGFVVGVEGVCPAPAAAQAGKADARVNCGGPFAWRTGAPAYTRQAEWRHNRSHRWAWESGEAQR